MFGTFTEERFNDILPGIKIKTLVHGQDTLMSKFVMQRGSKLPAHSHPYEQTGYLLNGKIRLTIADKSLEMKPGDSWCVGSGVEHSADILEDSSALEIFTPPRADYMKYFCSDDIK